MPSLRFRDLLEPIPEEVDFHAGLEGKPDVVMLFCLERQILTENLAAAADAIFPDGAVWVAWPKKASKISTDMTENVVRQVVLPMGLVENKVCAIDEIWSGLRVVWRKELRG